MSTSAAARSTLQLCHLCRFAPAQAASSLVARCSFPGELSRLLPQLPLPFRTVTSFWIKAFGWLAAVRSAFRLRPISPHSPQSISIASDDYGSTLKVRYVSGGLLFLKPLGTFLTMRSLITFVNTIVFFADLFNKMLLLFFQRLATRIR